MNFIKKHWYLLLVSLFTVGLGVVVYLSSQQLSQTSQVAPTVPQAQPQAAAPACDLAFNITGTTPGETPTETPTPTPEDTVTPTPTPTPTPENTATPTPTPPGQEIVYVTPTPTPVIVIPATCNSGCTVNTDCGGGLVCIDGACRNASCTTNSSCVCTVTTPQPTPETPVSGGATVLGASVIGIGALILILGLAL